MLIDIPRQGNIVTSDQALEAEFGSIRKGTNFCFFSKVAGYQVFNKTLMYKTLALKRTGKIVSAVNSCKIYKII